MAATLTRKTNRTDSNPTNDLAWGGWPEGDPRWDMTPHELKRLSETGGAPLEGIPERIAEVQSSWTPVEEMHRRLGILPETDDKQERDRAYHRAWKRGYRAKERAVLESSSEIPKIDECEVTRHELAIAELDHRGIDVPKKERRRARRVLYYRVEADGELHLVRHASGDPKKDASNSRFLHFDPTRSTEWPVEPSERPEFVSAPDAREMSHDDICNVEPVPAADRVLLIAELYDMLDESEQERYALTEAGWREAVEPVLVK